MNRPADFPVAAALAQATAGLVDFLAHSEAAFLRTGEDLSTLTSRASSLVGAPGEADVGGSPVDRLDAQIVGMRDCLSALRGASISRAEGLFEIRKRIDAVDRYRDDFEAAVQTLPILGLYARIENARPGLCSAGLDTVAADVLQLASGIAPKFEALFSEVASLRARLRQVGTGPSALANEPGAAERGVAEATEGLGRLREVWRSVEEMSVAVAAASHRIVRDVSTVLTSLQAHDLTRQRIEHVVEALRAMEAAAAHGAAEVPDERARRAIQIQLQQVRSAREQFSAALLEIRQSVEEVAGCVAGLRRQTAGVVGHGHDSPIGRVRAGVGRTTEALRGHLLSQRLACDELGRVTRAAAAMGGHVTAIEGIGADVKLVAINALIITGQLGEAGNAFSVVAGEIQAVARSLTVETAQVTTALKEISEAAELLQSSDGFAGDARFGEGEAIVSEMDAVVQDLRDVHEAQKLRLELLASGSAALEADVAMIRTRLDAAAARAGRLVEVEELLRRLASAGAIEEVGERGGGAARIALPMPDAYTMEAERAVHRAAAGVAESDVPPPVDSGLGANVEMF